jgi:hypothetical protein
VAPRRRVWSPHEQGDGTQRPWREADSIPPAAPFISAPDDVDAPDARPHTTLGVGDNVQRTATGDDDLPPVIPPSRRPSARRPMAPRPRRSTRRCRSGACCPTPLWWTPVAWTPHGGSRVGTLLAWSCWDPRVSTITGTPAQGPAVTPSTATWTGSGSTPPVRSARPVSAGPRPWISAGMPASRCRARPRMVDAATHALRASARRRVPPGARAPCGPSGTTTPDKPPGSATRQTRFRRRRRAAPGVKAPAHAGPGAHAGDGPAPAASGGGIWGPSAPQWG